MAPRVPVLTKFVSDSETLNRWQEHVLSILNPVLRVGATMFQSRPVSATAPDDGQVMAWDGEQWAPADTAPGGVTAVTGTAPIASSGGATPAISLNDTAVTPASYGDGTHVATFTVDQKGRLTAAASTAITGAAPTGAASGDLSGTYPAPTVAKIQTFPVDATTPTYGQLLTTDGAKWLPFYPTDYSGYGSGLVTGLQGHAVQSTSVADANLLIWTAGGTLQWQPHAMSGDATIANTGALTLKNTGTATTVGGVSSVPIITTDAQGRVSATSSATITTPQRPTLNGDEIFVWRCNDASGALAQSGSQFAGTLTLSSGSGTVGGTINGTLITRTWAGSDTLTATNLAIDINANATLSAANITAAGNAQTAGVVTISAASGVTLVATGTGCTASGANLTTAGNNLASTGTIFAYNAPGPFAAGVYPALSPAANLFWGAGGKNCPNAVSVSAWFYYRNSTGLTSVLCGKDDSDDNSITAITHSTVNLYLASGTTPTFSVTASANDTTVTGYALSTGVWHHVVGTYTSGQLNIYIDGEIAATQVTSLTGNVVQYATNWHVMGRKGISNQGILGTMAEVRVNSSALSAATIRAQYVAGMGWQ